MDTKTESLRIAQNYLTRLRLFRKVARMLEDGVSMEDISEQLSLTGRETTRLVRRVSFLSEGGVIPVSPTEIIYEAVVGDRSRDSMMDVLLNYEYTFGYNAEPDNPLSVRVPGSWDSILAQYSLGMLSDEEFETLFHKVKGEEEEEK